MLDVIVLPNKTSTEIQLKLLIALLVLGNYVLVMVSKDIISSIFSKHSIKLTQIIRESVISFICNNNLSKN